MEEKILTSLVAGFTKVFIDEAKKTFDNVVGVTYDEIKQYIGKDLDNYLKKHQEKYSHIKTLLRGNTPVYLYDIYFPAKLLTGNEEVILTNSVNTLVNRFQYITIIGDAGSGKSTLIKHLFLNSIFEKKYIPILVELRYLNDLDTSYNLEKLVKDICNNNKLHSNESIMERYLEEGKYIFFLDGFDELDEKTKKRTVKQLNDLIHKYTKNSFILTSRPYSNIEHLPLFTNLKMKDLSLEDGEIKGFVYKQLGNEKELAEKAVKSIEQGETHYINSFLINPLLLSLYLLTFQNYASIPDKKYIFYRRVINALFSEHDSKTKLGFVREKLCGLDQEQFEEVLKSFSFLSYFESEFVFDADYISKQLKIIKKRKNLEFDNNKFIQDLKSSISLWVDDDGEISFSHRSLQEYFAALFISELKENENKRVYDKIIDKFDKRENLLIREIENLLLLLGEIDLYNYTLNFHYQLLLKIREDFNNINQSTSEKKFVNFFMKGVVNHRLIRRHNQENGLNLYPMRTDILRKTIYLHYRFTRKLNNYIIDDIFSTGKYDFKLESFISVTKKQSDRNFGHIKAYLEFDQNNFDEFFNLIDSTFISELTFDFLNWLETEIKETEEYIKRVEKNEKDLVDLI